MASRKMRAWWPRHFNQKLADECREKRIPFFQGEVSYSEFMNVVRQMPGPSQPRMVSDEEVALWQDTAEWWLREGRFVE